MMMMMMMMMMMIMGSLTFLPEQRRVFGKLIFPSTAIP
jgi:hypothetical protein